MVPQEKTFVIAEAGINHEGNLQIAKDLAYAAKESGADAVKFQTYQTDKRVAKDNPAYDILKRCELSYDQQAELVEYCSEVEIEFFSTPFDSDSLNFLIDQKVKRIKLASFDVTNTEFLRAVNGKCEANPSLNVIMSVGMANRQEVLQALDNLNKVSNLYLLHCVSSYPTPEQEAGLLAVKSLGFIGNSHITRVGYSDHTSGIRVPALAVLVGATVIEKHFTLDLNSAAVDNPVSADPSMMKEMIETIRAYEELLGDGIIAMKEIEQAATAFRRKS